MIAYEMPCIGQLGASTRRLVSGISFRNLALTCTPAPPEQFLDSVAKCAVIDCLLHTLQIVRKVLNDRDG